MQPKYSEEELKANLGQKVRFKDRFGSYDETLLGYSPQGFVRVCLVTADADPRATYPMSQLLDSIRKGRYEGWVLWVPRDQLHTIWPSDTSMVTSRLVEDIEALSF